MIRELFAAAALFLGAASVLSIETRPTPDFADGTKALIDLPASQHIQNVGGSDGEGLCVYSAVTMGARWQNVTSFYNFRKFAEGRPGGSYPQKLDADIKTYAARNGIKVPDYIQHTGGDETFLDVLFQTRRMPCMTYAGAEGAGGYYPTTIAHMVSGAHLDETRGAIIDNNRPGQWITASRSFIVNRWKGLDDSGRALLIPVREGVRIVHRPVGGGWVFAWLAPPPPPKAPVVGKEVVQAGPYATWERVIGGDERPYWFLFVDGDARYVIDPDGKWHLAAGEDGYYPDVIEPPSDAPVRPTQELTAPSNNGVEFWKVSPEHRYFHNDVECTRGHAVAAALEPGEGGIVDDSDKYHLSVVTEDPKVTQALVTAWAGKYAKRLHVQVYKPTDWVATDRLTTAVTLQEPAKVGGKVVGTDGTVTEARIVKVLTELFEKPAPVKPAPDDKKDEPAGPSVDPNGWWKVLLAAAAVLAAVWFLLKGK